MTRLHTLTILYNEGERSGGRRGPGAAEGPLRQPRGFRGTLKMQEVYIHVHVYVCIYIYIYFYIPTHIYIYI